MNSNSQPSANDSSSQGRFVKIFLAVAALTALYFFGRQLSGYLEEFALWVEAQGPLGPIFFILGYAIGVVAFAPGAILTMLGGVLFGLAWGTLWVFCASTLGSCLAFLIARYVARERIEKKIEGNEKFAAIDRAIGKQGRKIVFLLRLTPVFPFSFGNYALGLTRVRFLDYFLGAFGTLPGTFLYVYYGKAVGDLATIAAGDAQVQRGPEHWILLGVGLLATLVVTALVTRTATRALREATEENEGDAEASRSDDSNDAGDTTES